MLGIVNISWFYTWQAVLLGIGEAVPAFVLTPRLVLSLRDLYARDLRGRRGSDIDTAFGLTSSGLDTMTVASQIVFAEGGENMGEEQGEERDDEQSKGREKGQGKEKDAEQDKEIQMADRAMTTGAGGIA